MVRLIAHIMWLSLLGLMPAHGLEATQAQDAPRWNQRVERVALFQDLSAQMDVQQVAALTEQPGGFTPLDQVGDATRSSPLPWWIKVTLSNPHDTRRSLRLILNPGATFRTASFYTQSEDKWKVVDPSRSAAEADGPTADRLRAIAVTLGPGESRTVLIRTTGVAPSHLVPFVYSDTAFREYLEHSVLWDGLLFGGLLALAWTAFMLALFSRNAVFLLLGVLSATSLLGAAAQRGYTRLYLFTDNVEWSFRSSFVFGQLSTLTFILFVLEIARTEKIRLPLRKLLIGWALYTVGLFAMSAFGDVYSASWLSGTLRPFFSLTLLTIAIILIKQHAPTRKIMLAVGVFSLTQATLVFLERQGLLPDYINGLTMATVRMNPVMALTGFFINLTVLSAWVAHVGLQRKDALQTISRLQAEENKRLTEQVAQQTEALNRALKYAGEKNRQQTQIVGYVSHDLRAPLATVAGYLQLLEQTARRDQRPHLDAIGRSVDYQLTLIDEILAYTTAELKPLSLRPVPTPLAAYLDEITQHATVLSHQQGNRFVLHTPNRLPKTVWLDGHRLRQVLLNLLSNAAKFTRAGAIRLDIRAVKRENDWQLNFIVSDSGIGMDPSGQAIIFEPFKQLEPSSAGVGLGLYITQSILRSMDSELCVDSTQGNGSAFSFKINVPTADDQTIHWTAPADLPTHAGVARDGERDTPHRNVPGDDGPFIIPPAHARTELAIMARDGHLTDIEQWLQAMSDSHPLSRAYFDEVRQALARLDFLAIEQLALAGSGTAMTMGPK